MLLPDLKYEKLTDIPAEDLRERGIRLVILDVDNTISPYRVDTCTDGVLSWAERMKEAGFTLYIVSNNKGDRPDKFAAQMGIGFLKRAKKPSPKGLYAAMAATGFPPEETALVGDQIYTDMLAAGQAGVTGVLVEPIRFTWPWLRWRYWAELPFRHVKKRRNKKE